MRTVAILIFAQLISLAFDANIALTAAQFANANLLRVAEAISQVNHG